MIPLSCAYCSHNPLQYGSLGLIAGYCVKHRVVLRHADETTCGQQLRKDLAVESRELAQINQRKSFRPDVVQLLRSAKPLEKANGVDDSDRSTLAATDAIADAATNYGFLESNIATLAQLKVLPGIRAELAMLSLSRAYVRNCLRRGGEWTSGVHLVWWTRKRLGERPEVKVSDLRHPTSTSLARQEELTAWSVVMLRLHLLADVAAAAPKADPLSLLVTVAEEAAEAADTPDLNASLEWISRTLEPRLKTSLPDKWYEHWRTALHSESEDENEDPPSTAG